MIRERDRERSEERLINTIGELVKEVGFEGLGINLVAKRAGHSKNLIYRYFDSLDGLIYAYMKKHDFWTNSNLELPDTQSLKEYLKGFFRRQIVEFRKNITLKRLIRWELSSNKDFLAEIRAHREKNAVYFIEMVSEFATISKEHIQAISALVNAGITYLTIFEDNCQQYNGINIQTDEGWNQIAQGIDFMIDIMIQ